MINTPASRKRQEFLSSVMQSLFARLREIAGRDDLRGREEAEVECIARDVGVSGYELRALARMPSDPFPLLYRRLAALHLDPQNPARIQSEVLRDLQVHCSLCASKKRCAGDLALHTLDSAWQDYCPNAYTLCALVAGAPVPDTIEDLIIYLNTVGEDSPAPTKNSDLADQRRRH